MAGGRTGVGVHPWPGPAHPARTGPARTGPARTGRADRWPTLAAGLLASLAHPVALDLVGDGVPWPVAGPGAYLVGAAVLARHWPSGGLRPADRVTLVRVVAVSWAATWLPAALLGTWPPAAHLLVVAVGVLALVLDGVDGRLARSRAEATEFGARFDLEADAALVLVLSLAVVLLEITGWWVLAIGLLRYGYLAASLRWWWLRPAVFASLARKVVGVAQVLALLLALLGPPVGLPPALLDLALVIALAALCWSFGRDVHWQHERRAQRGGQAWSARRA